MSIFDTTGFVIISVFFLGIVIGIIALFSILKGKLRMGYLLKIKILATYIGGILFISLIYIVFILPTVEAKEIGRLHVPDLYGVYQEGQQIAELPNEYIKETWDITLDGNELVIDAMINEWSFHTDIIVEKRDDVQPRVEVTLYETPSIVGNKDISDKILLNNIEVNDNIITILEQSVETEINYYGIENDLVTKQFVKNKSGDWESAIFGFDIGQQVLHISVPENIIIEGDGEYFIEYVE